MLIADLPSKITTAFAQAGAALKRVIPVASQQQSVNPAAASWTDGFPPITAQISGGIAPSILDMNGVLNTVTTIQKWQSGGGLFPYDAAWVAANGGYPKGAFLLRANGAGYWQSTVDNNSTNPDQGGAGWFEWSKANLDTLYASASALATLTATVNSFSSSGFGIGQTVQNMTAQRAFGTPFTNGTNKTITCYVSMGHPGPNGGYAVYDIYVGNEIVHQTYMGDANGDNKGDTRDLYTFLVPPGVTYQINYAAGSAATLYRWVEYR